MRTIRTRPMTDEPRPVPGAARTRWVWVSLLLVAAACLLATSPALAFPVPKCVDEFDDGPCPCGNGVCNVTAGETCTSCAADCGPCGPSCGDGVCGGGEDCASCAADCGACNPCGDGVCSLADGEDCESCAADCGVCDPCGDGICAVAVDGSPFGEDCQTCAEDCGPCPGCGDGLCNVFEGEDCSTCVADCGPCGPCGDGFCDALAGESCATCVQDCAPCDTCGDGICAIGVGSDETCGTCVEDCGPCKPDCEDDCADEPANPKTVDDIFERLQIEKYKDGGAEKDFTGWLAMVADLDPLDTFGANDSCVVRDDDDGSRSIYETTIIACNGKTYKVRFTKDSSNGASGFEIFIRDVTCDLPYKVGTILALGTDGAANLVDIVPPILAYDKCGNSRDGVDVVSAGIGCFQCHPEVSFDFDTPGADDFWGDFDPPDDADPPNGFCKIETTCTEVGGQFGLYADSYDATGCKNGTQCPFPPGIPFVGSWSICVEEGEELTIQRPCE